MGNRRRALNVTPRSSALGRRDLIKLGIGTGVGWKALPLGAQQLPALPTDGLGQTSSQNVQHWPDIQKSQEVAATTQTGYTVSTGPGWVNNSGRSFGNGPMDECRRRID